MRLRRPLLGTTTAALAALTLAACGSSEPAAPGAAPAADEGALTVVASTNVYGSIAEAVGGETVTVESLITDPSADPHSYESTPADAATVADGDLVILNGGGYDAFMPQLLEATEGQPAVIDVTELSGLAEEAAAGEAAAGAPEEETHSDEEGHAHEGEAHAEEEGHAHEEGEAHAEEEGHAHEHGAFNEHVWYSLPTVSELATRIATELGALDTANAATYTANAEAFSAEVAELTERVEAIGGAQPGTNVAVTEPIPYYLIETAGLTDVTPPAFTEAVEEDTDPPAAVVAETLALFEPGAPQVRALILNSQTQTPTTDQVREAAEAAGVPVVEMSETLPEGQDEYLAWMNAQVDELSSALNPV